MRKFILFLLISNLILLLIACQPTTTSPDSTEPEPAMEFEAETAVPNPPIESAETEPTPTETAVPKATPSPTPTAISIFTAEPLPTISTEGQPMPNTPGNAIELSPKDYPETVNIAVQDLAERLNVDESEIEIVSVEMVIWPDASMGCPQPDMAYKQVPQDGLLIRLEIDGQIYNYHSGGIRDPFLCESPAKGMSPGEGIIPPPGDMDT